MKKIITLLTIALFTINASAQEAKKEKAKKESCCMAKESDTKTMSAEDVAKCQKKCKAKNRICSAKTSKKEREKR